MKKGFTIILLMYGLSASSQCAETPSLTATGGGCLGTASFNISGVSNISKVKWYRDNSLVYDFEPVYNFSNTMVGGGQGSAANQLRYPNGLCVDRNGFLYVADKDNHRVQKFAPGSTNGITIAGGNGQGGNLNQLNYPTGVKVDGNGNVYISDNNNHRIVKWAPGATVGVVVAGGNGQGSATNQLSYPGGLDLDSAGNIYVADNSNHRIVKWGPGALSGIVVAGGNGQGSAANQLNYPHGVAVDALGSIYIADDNPKIQKWLPGAVAGITILGTGVAGNASNQVNAVSSVFVDKRGYVFIGDGNNDRVQCLAPGGLFAKTVAGGNGRGDGATQLAYPSGIFIDTTGSIFVCDILNHRIQKWGPVGDLRILSAANITSTGSYNTVISTFNGCNFISNNVIIYPTGSVTPTIAYNNFYKASCQNFPASFTASIDKEIPSMTFQWLKNNTSVANETDSIYITNSLANGDSVKCKIICNANGCITNDTVYTDSKIYFNKPEYTFNGNGNWNNPANWANGKIPPTDLACCSKIIIDPQASGECIINIPVTIPACVDFVVNPGKKIRILGDFVNRYDSTIVINSNVYVPSDNLMTLTSGIVELTQGIYKYSFTGILPSFHQGDVLIGSDGEGYIRIIDNFSIAGNSITFNTHQGAMENVFKQGRLNNTLSTDSTLQRPVSSDFNYAFSEITLTQGAGYFLKLTNGNISLNPNWDFNLDFSNFSLHSLNAGFQNATYNAKFDVYAIVTSQLASFERTDTLKTFKKSFTRIVPVYGIPVPVVITMQLDIIAKSSGSVNSASSWVIRCNNTGQISLNLSYNNGSWNSSYSQNITNTINPDIPTTNINAELNVSVIPTFSFKLYGIVGPYAGLGIGTTAQANGSHPFLNWDFMSGIWLKSNAGVNAEAFGNSIFNYNMEWNSDSVKYETPFKLVKISGDNQNGSSSNWLPLPLKVRVVDNLNLAQSNVPVYFRVTAGGGIISANTALTDNNGYAQVNWLLGSNGVIQTVEAKAMKADGSILINGPMEFAASINPLPQLTTASIQSITDTSAISGGIITNEGIYPVTSRGICWSTSHNPTINNFKTIDGTGAGTYTSSINNLTINTVYYVRAYATNAAGTSYGEELTFTTKAEGTFTDPRDGQQYTYKQIGTQIWMTKNLNYVTDSSWCYNNNSANCDIYGRLYNWHDALIAAPPGWHLPSDAEWQTLVNYLGGNAVAGGTMKSTTGWQFSPDAGATNSSGFNGLPGGYRNSNFLFYTYLYNGDWWSSTPVDGTLSWYLGVTYNGPSAIRTYAYPSVGLSIRCIRD